MLVVAYQGKFEIVKAECIRMIIFVLGISELKWKGMKHLNSNDFVVFLFGQQLNDKKWHSIYSKQGSKEFNSRL